MKISIPGHATLCIDHLVLDYNGTLARDGQIIPGVRENLVELAAVLNLHILTADTFGTVKTAAEGIPATLTVLPAGGQDRLKARYVNTLGARNCAAIGNGRNDALMLSRAAIGVAVIGPEGAASRVLSRADIICVSITDALQLFLNPLRVAATLRT